MVANSCANVHVSSSKCPNFRGRSRMPTSHESWDILKMVLHGEGQKVTPEGVIMSLIDSIMRKRMLGILFNRKCYARQLRQLLNPDSLTHLICASTRRAGAFQVSRSVSNPNRDISSESGAGHCSRYCRIQRRSRRCVSAESLGFPSLCFARR